MTCPGCVGGNCFILTLLLIIVIAFTTLFCHVYFIVSSPETNFASEPFRQHDPTPPSPYPGDRDDNLLWFIQITDLHISRYRGLPERVSQLKSFFQEHISVIKPEVVLITGDLTDAKDVTRLGSQQYEDEWLMYQNVITDSNLLNKTVVLDIRGNHDAFNIPNLDHGENFYRKYSVQGQKHVTSYLHIVNKTFGKYAFIGVDACPDPGIKRPYNFFGYLNDKAWEQLVNLKDKVSRGHMNGTVWFGHYPSSVVLNENALMLKSLISAGSVYVCGHMHTLGGLVPQLYTKQSSGILELELGDWLDHRLYRVLVFDHDLFSFSDEVYGKWPVVIITNPKHALFRMPLHEPIGRIMQSTHIRILTFSIHKILSVKVWVDGISYGTAKHVGRSLYVVSWLPQKYLSGLHNIKVEVLDSGANEQTIIQPFTLDNNIEITFPFITRLLLMSDISILLKILFMSVWLLAIVPVLFLHCYGRILRGSVQCGGPLVGCVRRWYHHYLLLSRTNSLFYPLLLFDLYTALGPWFIGFVLEEHLGVMFVYGVYVLGHLLPMYTTLAYGTIQILTFNIPLVANLAAFADCSTVIPRKNHLKTSNVILCLQSWFSLNKCAFILILIFQGFRIISNYLSYGIVATVLSPIVSWPLFFAIIMRRQAHRIHQQNSAHYS